jgi:hypothetical protein
MLGPKAHICGIGDTNPKKFNTTSIYAADDENKNDEVKLIKSVFKNNYFYI